MSEKQRKISNLRILIQKRKDAIFGMNPASSYRHELENDLVELEKELRNLEKRED